MEPYYSTEFHARSLDLTTPSIHPELALPSSNPFIPTNLEIMSKSPVAAPELCPSLIQQGPRSRLFFKRESWNLPRATAIFLFKTTVPESAASAVKLQLFCQLVEEGLTEVSYDAAAAGLGFSVGTDPRGFELQISGYSEKLGLLLEVVLRAITGLQVDKDRFKLLHDRVSTAASSFAEY